MNYRFKENTVIPKGSDKKLVKYELNKLIPLDPSYIANILKELPDGEYYLDQDQKRYHTFDSLFGREFRYGHRMTYLHSQTEPQVQNLVLGLGHLELFLAKRNNSFKENLPQHIIDFSSKENYKAKFFSYQMANTEIIEIYCDPTYHNQTELFANALLPASQGTHRIKEFLELKVEEILRQVDKYPDQGFRKENKLLGFLSKKGQYQPISPSYKRKK